MNREVFRRWQINIDVDENAEKEYSFVNGDRVFHSGDVCIGAPSLYNLSGRLSSEIEREFVFLYKVGDYYYVSMNDKEYVFTEPKRYIIKHKEKPKRQLDNWEQVKLGLYIILMLFGVIVKARFAWWIFITAMFFTFKKKKPD